MTDYCFMPQGHPTHCGCTPPKEPLKPMLPGYSVIVSDDLPAQTMIVSRDIFEQLCRELKS